MFSFLRNLFLPIHSSFAVNEVDHLRKVVVVEDKQLGLKVEIPFGDKALKKSQDYRTLCGLAYLSRRYQSTKAYS